MAWIWELHWHHINQQDRGKLFSTMSAFSGFIRIGITLRWHQEQKNVLGYQNCRLLSHVYNKGETSKVSMKKYYCHHTDHCPPPSLRCSGARIHQQKQNQAWNRYRKAAIEWWCHHKFEEVVRLTLLLASNPQRRQEEWKRKCYWLFLCGDCSGIPREQNEELTTTWASIYI